MKCRHILKLAVKVALWCFLAVASFGERFLPNDQVYRNGAFIVNIVLPLYVGYLFILIFSGWLKLEELSFRVKKDYYIIRDELIILYSIIVILLCVVLGQCWLQEL